MTKWTVTQYEPSNATLKDSLEEKFDKLMNISKRLEKKIDILDLLTKLLEAILTEKKCELCKTNSIQKLCPDCNRMVCNTCLPDEDSYCEACGRAEAMSSRGY